MTKTDTTIKEKAIEKRNEGILKEGDQKYFSEHLIGPYNFSVYFVIPAFILVSFLTEYAFMYARVNNFSNNLILSHLTALTIALLLETIKFKMGYTWTRFFTNKWLFDGGHYVKSFILLSPVVVGAYFGSAYMSIKGTPMTVELIGGYFTGPSLVDIDAIDLQIQQADKVKWKGTRTTQTQETINELTIQRTEALAENNRRVLAHEVRLKKNGQTLSSFCGYIELASFLAVVFLSYYRRKAYVELTSRIPIDLPQQTHSKPITTSKNNSKSMANPQQDHSKSHSNASKSTPDSRNTTDLLSTIDEYLSDIDLLMEENHDKPVLLDSLRKKKQDIQIQKSKFTKGQTEETTSKNIEGLMREALQKTGK